MDNMARLRWAILGTLIAVALASSLVAVLLGGTYYVSVAVHNWEDTRTYDYHDRLYPFRVLPSEGERYGILTLKGEWH